MSFYRPLPDIAEAHAQWAQSDDPRIPLGYPIFDKRTKGAAIGELVMFLARSGTGKTAWGCNVVVNNRRVPTVFFSLEMEARYIAQRCAAIYSNQPTEHIEQNLKNYGTDSALELFVQDFPYLAIIDQPGMGLRDMGKAIGEVTEAWGGHRPRLVIIDYLELVRAPAMSAVEGIDTISRKLKDWTREQQVVTVVLHQLKQAESKKDDWGPVSRRDARYGGDVAADYTLAAYRPGLAPGSDYPTTDFYMQFLKTRTSGGLHPSGLWHYFDEPTLRITTEKPAGRP